MTKRSVAPEPSCDSVEALREVVTELRDEVRMLYHAIDEFRTDFTHCLRNLPDNLPPPYAHLGAMFSAFSNDLPRGNTVPNNQREDEETM